MDEPRIETSGLRAVASRKRKSVAVSELGPVERSPLASDARLPLVLRPTVPEFDAVAWAASHRERLLSRLRDHGAVLLRDSQLSTPADLERLIAVLSDGAIDYTYRSTPRSQVSGKIYTTTEYAADLEIPMHNEMSYASTWPRKLWFLCVRPAERGGLTPLADSREMLAGIDPQVRQRFVEKKVMYVRNYAEGLDIPWQTVFQTEDRSEVEDFCRRSGISWQWKGARGLRTWQVCEAVQRHPETGDEVWFNQANLFHVSALEPRTRESLLRVVDPEDLPRNAYFGDGSGIDPEDIRSIAETYRRQSIRFPWRAGDLLMLDNMLVAHGRTSFEGARTVLAGMAEPFTGSATADGSTPSS